MGSTYLITGGTGTLGTAIVKRLLDKGHKVRTLSRDGHKIEALERQFTNEQRVNLTCLTGDVRDLDRVKRALHDVQYVIHAAAEKIIGRCEFDPMEAVKTNIIGTMNVAAACADAGVSKAIFVSSDKAAAASNLYGATKFAGERLWLASNRYRGAWGGCFVAIRYGNVFGSAGSVIHSLMRQKHTGKFTITDKRMTRYHLRIESAVDIVLYALEHLAPGEMFIPKLPSYSITDLAAAVDDQCALDIIGRQPGEKLAEALISENEAPYATEHKEYYILTPSNAVQKGGWEYNSSTNQWRLGREQLKEEIGMLFVDKGAMLA